MPELFQISWSHSGMGKKVGSMDLVRLSGGLLVKNHTHKSYDIFLGFTPTSLYTLVHQLNAPTFSP